MEPHFFLALTCLTILALTKAQDNIDSLIDNVWGAAANPSTSARPITSLPDVESVNSDGSSVCKCVHFLHCTSGHILRDIKSPVCLPMEVCCANSQPIKEIQIVIPKKESQCGKPGMDNGFAKQGSAQYGEFPWTVVLFEEETQNGNKGRNYRCQGALIHERAILTAAHCIDMINTRNLWIRAGEWDISTDKELHPHQDRTVSQAIIHERFYQDRTNDIALIVTSKPFILGPNIGIICLPEPNQVILDNFCRATGWRKDDNSQSNNGQSVTQPVQAQSKGLNILGGLQNLIKFKVDKVNALKDGLLNTILPGRTATPSNSNNRSDQVDGTLKVVELAIVPKGRCQSEFRRTKLGLQHIVHRNYVCAGSSNVLDAWKGDDGGPLVCPIGGKVNYQQVGIVSSEATRGNPWPAAYINVAGFRRWIDEKMDALHFTIDYDYA